MSEEQIKQAEMAASDIPRSEARHWYFRGRALALEHQSWPEIASERDAMSREALAAAGREGRHAFRRGYSLQPEDSGV